MKRKRIIILHHTFAQGGGTKSAIDIAVMLKKDFDVILCLPQGSDKTIELAGKYNLVCHELSISVPVLGVYSGGPKYLSKSFIKGIFKFKDISAFVDELLSLKPDVIIFNSIVTSLIARKVPKSIRTICFIRETIVNSVFDKLIKDTFENYIDGVAYIAEHERRVLELKKPIQVIIPDTLEPLSFKIQPQEQAKGSLNLENNKFHVLYMGGSESLKGFDIMLESMSYLDNSYCALIVGDINLNLFSIKNIVFHIYNVDYFCYLLKARKLLNRLKKDSRIKLLGYQKNIAPFMCASDVVAFPSRYPHQPRPCIEAGMYGKPVVISDFDATKEYFVNNYNALTFIPLSGKDLAKKIKLLRENEVLRKLLGKNNYLMSCEKHNFTKIQDVTIRFIKEVVLNQAH